MQYIYNPKVRIHMLIVYKMLQLVVRYDHIENNNYKLIVVWEAAVLAKLRKHLGDTFRVETSLLEGNMGHYVQGQ